MILSSVNKHAKRTFTKKTRQEANKQMFEALSEYIPKLHLVLNKLHHRNVLLNSFHLNGHILGFHPQTKKIGPPCI